jgi:hypothetical protein
MTIGCTTQSLNNKCISNDNNRNIFTRYDGHRPSSWYFSLWPQLSRCMSLSLTIYLRLHLNLLLSVDGILCIFNNIFFVVFGLRGTRVMRINTFHLYHLFIHSYHKYVSAASKLDVGLCRMTQCTVSVFTNGRRITVELIFFRKIKRMAPPR